MGGKNAAAGQFAEGPLAGRESMSCGTEFLVEIHAAIPARWRRLLQGLPPLIARGRVKIKPAGVWRQWP
jgi:hypothetical protein